MQKQIILKNGVRVDIESFTGTVQESKVWSETSVSSTPTAGYVHSSGVMIGGGSRVQSKTTEKREIWLKADDGTEKCFSFNNIELQTRTGHLVTVVQGGTTKERRNTYLSIHLHTTGETYDCLEKSLEATMYRMGVFSQALLALRAAIYIGGIFLLIGFFIAPIGALIVYFVRRPIKADLKEKVRALLPSLLPQKAPTKAAA